MALKIKLWQGFLIGLGIMFTLGLTVLDPVFAADLTTYFIIIYGGYWVYSWLVGRRAKKQPSQKTAI